jgi:ribose transport system ATP-binding protein
MPQQGIIASRVGRSIATMQHTPRTFEDRALLSVRNLGYTRHDRQGADHQFLSDVSFEVRPGEILGIGGLLGSGRTEILECLFGAARGDVSGEIWIDGVRAHIGNPQDAKALGLAFVTEERKTTGLFLAAPIAENITLPSLRRLSRFALPNRKAEANLVKDLFGRLTVRARNAEQRVQELSGGNQQKVVLAKWLGTQPRMLLLDEPTRGIDVGAKAEIYELVRTLAADGLSILLVSSELPELLLLADRILVMCEGRQVGILDRSEATEEKFMTLAAPKSSAATHGGRV